MTDPVTTCRKDVWDRVGFRSSTCGRPIKRDGLCGIHAAAIDKMKANDKKHAEERKASGERQSAAQAVLDELGVEGAPEYSTFTSKYTGRVTVSIETLRALAARDPHANTERADDE